MLPGLFLSTDTFFDPDGTPKLPYDELVLVFEQLVDPGLSMRRQDRVVLRGVCRDLQSYARARRAITNDDTWRAMTTALRLPVDDGETHREAVNRWCREGYGVDQNLSAAWLRRMMFSKTTADKLAAKDALLWCARVYSPLPFLRAMANIHRVDIFMDIVRLYRVTNADLIVMRDEYYPRIGFGEWEAPETAMDENDDYEGDGRAERWRDTWGWWQDLQLIFRYAVENAAEDRLDCLDALMRNYEPALVVDAVVLHLRHSPYAAHARARREQLSGMIDDLMAAVPEAQRVDVANDVIARVDRAGWRFGTASARPKSYLASVILHIVDAVGEEMMDPSGGKSWEHVTLEQLRAWEESQDDQDLPWDGAPIDPAVDDYVDYDEEDVSDSEGEQDSD